MPLALSLLDLDGLDDLFDGDTINGIEVTLWIMAALIAIMVAHTLRDRRLARQRASIMLKPDDVPATHRRGRA